MANETKPNQTKADKTKADETNPLEFEVPLSPEETKQMYTDFMRNRRKMEVTAVSGRYQSGWLLVRVVPGNSNA